MKKKPFVAVIGGAKSGKSTVIRSLTGCPFGNPRRGQVVRDNLSGIGIYVIDKSPQESGLKARDLNRVLDRYTKDNSVLGFIIALQPTWPTSRISIEQVFQAVSERRQLRPIAVVLNPRYSGRANPGLLREVQRRLRPFNVNVVRFDGQRFAYLNARRIRQIANMP